VDYRKFRQWSPPTRVGSIAYPSFDKSFDAQKAVPSHYMPEWKPPKGSAMTPLVSDNHYETAKHDLLSVHHSKMGNSAIAAKHVKLASNLRKDSINPGNPQRYHYLDAAKMLGLRKSDDDQDEEV